MTRKTVRLTPEHLLGLPAPCTTCLFWEQDPVARSRNGDVPGAKRAWLERVLEEWGPCGQVALVDDRPVGYVVYAPEAFVPGTAAFPTAPVSPDAVVLTHAWVDPAHARGGVGKLLVQRMARDLVRREVRAVEAFADTRGAGTCLVPLEFLTAVGFTTQRAHGTTPRLRMELRTALTWRTPVEATLQRLVGAVRPQPKATRGTAPRSRTQAM